MFLPAALLCNYGRDKCLIDIGTEGFDTLLVGTEVGVLVDKTSETMAAV